VHSDVRDLTASVNAFRPDGTVADAPALGVEALDFEAIYSQYFDFAYRSLRLLGVEPDALEDRAQDVFGIVAQRLSSFEGKSSVKTWIFGIAQRVAANHRRVRRRKLDRLEPLEEPLAAPDAGPDAHADAARTARLIQAFATSLDEERRALFVLGLLERVPPRELAESLGVPLFTMYSRLRSVREACRAFLAEYEVGC